MEVKESRSFKVRGGQPLPGREWGRGRGAGEPARPGEGGGERRDPQRDGS